MPVDYRFLAKPMSVPPLTSQPHFAAQTDAGQVREHNEDSLLCCPELGLWAVADGMGGHQRGEVASALALKVLREQVAQGQALDQAVLCAHEAVLAAGEQDIDSRGMGTTLVAALVQGRLFTLVWVGDSRIYRISAQQIEQLTRDHSWVQAMVDAGELSAEAARSHAQRNVITQCVGHADIQLQPDVLTGELQPGEILLLCSDGLTGELTDTQILQHCAQASTLETLVAELIASANQHGGKDNVSCIVLAPAAIELERPVPRKRGLLRFLFSARKPS